MPNQDNLGEPVPKGENQPVLDENTRTTTERKTMPDKPIEAEILDTGQTITEQEEPMNQEEKDRILDEPSTIDRLREAAEAAIRYKWSKQRPKGQKLQEFVEERSSDIVNGMWVKLASMDNPSEIVTNPIELQRLAASVTTAARKAEQDIVTRLERLGPRTDMTLTLRNWEQMTKLEQVTQAARFSNNRLIDPNLYLQALKDRNLTMVDKVVGRAQAVLSAHTLLNQPGRGSPAEIVQKASDPPKRDKERSTVDFGTVNRNLGYAFTPLYTVHIAHTGPIAEVMEYSLSQSRSAESVFFRTIRQDTLFEAMTPILPLMLFRFGSGTEGVNFTEAYRVLKGHEPSKKDLQRFIRAIRHQASYFAENAAIQEEVHMTPQKWGKRQELVQQLAKLAGLPNPLDMRYSDKAVGTVTPYVPDQKRPEAEIVEEIRRNHLGLDVLVERLVNVTNENNSDVAAAIDQIGTNLRIGRKATDRLYSELLDK